MNVNSEPGIASAPNKDAVHCLWWNGRSWPRVHSLWDGCSVGTKSVERQLNQGTYWCVPGKFVHLNPQNPKDTSVLCEPALKSWTVCQVLKENHWWIVTHTHAKLRRDFQLHPDRSISQSQPNWSEEILESMPSGKNLRKATHDLILSSTRILLQSDNHASEAVQASVFVKINRKPYKYWVDEPNKN